MTKDYSFLRFASARPFVTLMVCIVKDIVVTNVSNVIYNFERNGLSKVIYSEKVINLFQR